MSDRRVLLGTSAVLFGLGSALMSGTAVAGADSGEAGANNEASSGEAASASASGSEASSPAANPRRAATRARAAAGPAAGTAATGREAATRAGRLATRPGRTPSEAIPTNPAPAKTDPNAASPAAAVPAASQSIGSAQAAQAVQAAQAAQDAPAAPVPTANPGIDIDVAPASATPPALVQVAAAQAAPAVAVAYAAPAPAAAPAPTLLSTVLANLGWQPAGGLAVAAPALAAFTGQRQSAASAAVIGAPAAAAAPPDPVEEAADRVAEGVAAQVTTMLGADPLLPGFSNGVSGVQVGHSRLDIPGAFIGQSVAADWYFPTQVDGTVDAQGVIWLQHGFGATNTFYSALATELAQRTNSIVVAPTLSSIPLTFSGGCLTCDTSQEAAAEAFLDPNRTALTDSALAAGYAGDVSELQGLFVLAGHSAGGGFATATAADYIGAGSELQDADLAGVVMFDGVSNGTFDGTFTDQLGVLDTADIPVYQIAAPAQAWNAFGATTNQLLAARPGVFNGAVLVNGSHVDSMLGSNPIVDFVAELVTRFSPAGNTAAVYNLSTGWINDLFAGETPQTAQYGLYSAANGQIIMGDAAAVSLPTPLANNLSPLDTVLKDVIDAVGSLFGLTPTPVVNTGVNGVTGYVKPPLSNGVTGVRTGSSALLIPSGDNGYNAPADWYFPTQADGSVQANGVIWLQHGFLGFNAWYADMAQALAQETNSIVVAPNIFWFDPAFTGEAAAQMFVGDRAALNVSANEAGYLGMLPQEFILTGHSAGGRFATAAGAGTVDNGSSGDLLGVVMFDGVSRPPVFNEQLQTLIGAGIPDYQIAAPPQQWNAWGVATEAMLTEYPDQFFGVQIDNGSHTDVIGGNSLFGWLGELGSDLIVRPSPPGGKAAVRTFATGWVNDLYSGNGPTNPLHGIYGNPNDGTYVGNQPISMGEAGATTLPAPPPVTVDPDLPPTENYLGTWFEQGSVKQFFSIGLVNTKAVYSLNDDGSIKVENSGNYFGPNGPASNITGSAVPVNAANTRLNVGFFFGEPSSEEPGNYWILDYAPDYSWAIVSDSSGRSGFILTRDQVIPGAEYDDLVARAQQLGVSGNITPTAQFPTTVTV